MSEENSTNTMPRNYDHNTNCSETLSKLLYTTIDKCNLFDPRVIKPDEDEKIKFKFANNKKAIEYNFKSAESNDFTLGISDTSQWTFAPKQQEQRLQYNFK
jgi:hypothetical protein